MFTHFILIVTLQCDSMFNCFHSSSLRIPCNNNNKIVIIITLIIIIITLIIIIVIIMVRYERNH